MMAVSHLATMKVTPDEHGKRRFMTKLKDPNFKKVSFSYICSDSKNRLSDPVFGDKNAFLVRERPDFGHV